MATATGDLQALFSAGTAGNLSDAQLIERFLSGRDGVAEPAFATLVARHGNMVMGACLAILKDRHDAEDAFQATFLVFARKAGSVRNSEALGCWLYGVSRRVAGRARRLLARRRDVERRGALAMLNRPECRPGDDWSELYEELDRLPARFRGPIVLCDLEGFTYEEAARQLRCPRGTVQSRLSRGRERLRGRLLRRGITVPATAFAVSLFDRSATAHVSPALCEQTTRAVMSGMAGTSATGFVGVLARSALRRLTRARFILLGAIMGTAALVAVAIALGAVGEEKPVAANAPAAVPAPASEALVVKVVDPLGHARANLDVQLLSPDEGHSWKTDSEGIVRIPPALIDRVTSLIAKPEDATLGWVEYVRERADPAIGTAAQPLILSLRPLTRMVRGSVLDGANQPIAGARVQVRSIRDATSQIHHFSAVAPGQLWPLGEAVTDQNGEYKLAMPERASASLVARHPRYVGPSILCPEQGEVVAPARLNDAGQIRGRVTHAETGEPVPGAHVGAQVIASNPGLLTGGWCEAVSDADGRYTLGGLEAEVYNVLLMRVDRNRKLTAEAIEAVRVKVGEAVEVPFKVFVGRHLHGTIFDDDTGQTLADITVGYYGAARPRSGGAIMSTKSDAQGHFELFVPPGAAFIYTMDPNYGGPRNEVTLTVPVDRDPQPATFQIFKRGPTAMLGAGGMMKAVAVKRVEPKKPEEERAVRGTVVDSAARPVRGVHVYFQEESYFRAAATDSDGKFEITGLPKGKIGLSFQREGFSSQQELVAADRKELRVVLKPALPLPAPPDASAEASEPPKAQTQPPAENIFFVNLQGVANARLVEGPGGGGNDLGWLPSGLQAFGEHWFSVGRKMVHVAGQNTPQLPPRVDGINVGARVKRLIFLHATEQAAANGTEIAAYRVNYGDGTQERIPIAYGVHIANWWDFGGKPERPTKASLAWTGRNQNIAAHNPKWRIHLFSLSWANPHPEKVVQTIDIISAGTPCDPFVVAITAERN